MIDERPQASRWSVVPWVDRSGRAVRYHASRTPCLSEWLGGISILLGLVFFLSIPPPTMLLKPSTAFSVATRTS